MGRYVYRPAHPWRHGYRREKKKQIFFLLLKILFMAEILILSERYIAEHMTRTVYEKEIVENEDTGEEFFGIGIDGETHTLIWFHKYQETE